jgi:hypothetical protein
MSRPREETAEAIIERHAEIYARYLFQKVLGNDVGYVRTERDVNLLGKHVKIIVYVSDDQCCLSVNCKDGADSELQIAVQDSVKWGMYNGLDRISAAVWIQAKVNAVCAQQWLCLYGVPYA